MQLYTNNIAYRYNENLIKAVKKRKKFEFKKDREFEELVDKFEFMFMISDWETSVLNNVVSQQVMKNYHIVEAPSYSLDIVFDNLQKAGKYVILEKEFKKVEKYIIHDEIYILKKLSVDAPLEKVKTLNDMSTIIKKTYVRKPKIEKVLIDVFNDKFFKKIYECEIENIYREILEKYKINVSTMMRYADKKHCKDDVKSFFEDIGFDIERGEFDDNR